MNLDHAYNSDSAQNVYGMVPFNIDRLLYFICCSR